MLLGRLDEEPARPQVAAQHQARDAMGEQIVRPRLLHRGVERAQVGDLDVADDLDALGREVALEAGEGEAGAVDGRLADGALQPGRAGDELQAQLDGVAGVELRDGDDGGGGHGRVRR